MCEQAPTNINSRQEILDSEGERMTANIADVLNIPYDHAQEMTDYLAEIDPRNYRDYSRWFRLMVKCKYAGVDRQVWIDWCTRDPDYAADAKKIGKSWDSLKR